MKKNIAPLSLSVNKKNSHFHGEKNLPNKWSSILPLDRGEQSSVDPKVKKPLTSGVQRLVKPDINVLSVLLILQMQPYFKMNYYYYTSSALVLTFSPGKHIHYQYQSMCKEIRFYIMSIIIQISQSSPNYCENQATASPYLQLWPLYYIPWFCLVWIRMGISLMHTPCPAMYY